MSRMKVLLFLLLPVLAAAQPIDSDTIEVAWTRKTGLLRDSLWRAATDVAASGLGDVVVCGASDHQGHTSDVDIAVVKYNQWGDLLWDAYIDGSVHDDIEDMAHAVAVDSAGNIFVAGQIEDMQTEIDGVVAKYNSSGSRQWLYQSEWDDDEVLYDVIIGQSQDVYVCGVRWDTSYATTAYLVMRLNPANGSVVWDTSFVMDTTAFGSSSLPLSRGRPPVDGHPDFFEDWDQWSNCATALAISPSDGKLVVTGFGFHDIKEYEMWTMKFSTNGARDWENEWGQTTGELFDAAFDVAVSDSGDVYICGLAEGLSTAYDFGVARLSSAGTYLDDYTQDADELDEWATAVCLDEAAPQNVYVTGFLNWVSVSYHRDVLTHRFDRSLSPLWSTGALWGDSGEDLGYDICYRQGKIFVAGGGGWAVGEPNDARVICYTPTNAFPKLPYWNIMTQLDVPEISFEVATSVAVPDTNNVYVGMRVNIDWLPHRRSEMYAARLFRADYDMRADSILVPCGRVSLGDTFAPRVWYVNEGNYRSIVSTRLFIQPSYYDTFPLDTLYPGDTAVHTYVSWVAQPVGTLAVKCTLAMSGDRDPFNNFIQRSVEVVSHNVGCRSITAPSGLVDSGAMVTPRAWIHNYGVVSETFNCWMEIGTGYADTATVASLAPGDSVLRSFALWVARERGALAVKCSTMLAGDAVEPDNAAVGSTFVRVLDAATVSILAPTGTIDSGAAVVPSARITNRGNAMISFNARYDIIQTDGPDPGGVRITAGPERKPGGGGGLDDYSDTQLVSNLAPGETRDVNFAQWDAAGRGLFSTRCSTRLTGDMDNANDRATRLVTLRVADMGAAAILVPGGTYSPNSVVFPQVTWHNYGTTVADFAGWVLLHDPALNRVYSEQVNVTGLLSGRDTTITFAVPCTLVSLGMWRARCSTYMAGDMHPANDHIDQFFNVRENPDVGVMAIIAPVGRVDTGAVVTPQARVRNLGDVIASFRAWFIITAPADSEVYRDYFDVMSLLPGAELTMSFPDWLGTNERGRYTSSCTLAIDDVNPANDTASRAFIVGMGPIWPNGWVEVKPVPNGPRGRPVKRGGSVDCVPADTVLIYATKGYKTTEFYVYNMFTNSWDSLAPVPLGPEGRPPGKGAKLCSDAERYIYLTKGYNTVGFWRYDVQLDTWEQRTNVPLGPSGKRVKGGTDMAWVVKDDTGWAYLLKGYRTDFFKYDAERDNWVQLPNAPTGIKYKWNKGSWLSYDGEQTIYAHKARYYDRAKYEHELWRYDTEADTWYTDKLSGMPLYGLHSGRIRKKKAKDGGCAAFHEGLVYALKGGNTQQFWKYYTQGDSWVETDTMPAYGSTGRKKRVKYGGDMVYTSNAFWALKGNKTLEFWRYGLAEDTMPVFGRRPMPAVATGPGVRVSGWEFDVRPNPLAAGGALHYAVPDPVAITARLYDALGRRVHTLMAGRTVSGRGAIRLDTRDVARGVYLLWIEAGGLVRSFKVVIE